MKEKKQFKHRRKVVYFTPELILGMITQGERIPANSVECLAGVPPGTKFVYGFYCTKRQAFGMVLAHDTFPLVDDRLPAGPEVEIDVKMLSLADE